MLLWSRGLRQDNKKILTKMFSIVSMLIRHLCWVLLMMNMLCIRKCVGTSYNGLNLFQNGGS